jgi:hypothetical protein
MIRRTSSGGENHGQGQARFAELTTGTLAFWKDRAARAANPPLDSRADRAHFAGGRNGPSAHLRAVGSCSGSSSQSVQTYRSRPSRASSRTAFIGLPHAGHAFRTG